MPVTSRGARIVAWGSAITLGAALLATLACHGGTAEAAAAPPATGGDAARGKLVIQRVGCEACHVIPGVAGPKTNVGPSLAGIAGRVFVGGVLPNTPDDMVRWIQDPPAVDSLTAMPALGLTEQQARDVAAYLYTLH